MDSDSVSHSVGSNSLQPMDCSPPGSSVHGILQARILEWVAISFSRGSSQPKDRICISCVSCIGRQLLYRCSTWEAKIFATLGNLRMTQWTVAYQAPLSMEFSRQVYWTGEPFPSSGHLHEPGSEPRFPALQDGFFPI